MIKTTHIRVFLHTREIMEARKASVLFDWKRKFNFDCLFIFLLKYCYKKFKKWISAQLLLRPKMFQSKNGDQEPIHRSHFEGFRPNGILHPIKCNIFRVSYKKGCTEVFSYSVHGFEFSLYRIVTPCPTDLPAVGKHWGLHLGSKLSEIYIFLIY